MNYSGHHIGERPRIHRTRVSHRQWVRQQILRFADVFREAVQVPLEQLRPVASYPVSTAPVDPSEAGHIRVTRWTPGSGDGFQALGSIFDVDALHLLRDWLQDERRRDYRHIYGEDADRFLDAAFGSIDSGTGGVMPDDVAQYMVDRMQIAMIMVRDDGEEQPNEVVLLIPRFTTAPRISSRCLIFRAGGWSVGEWTLPNLNQGSVPLFGLPVAHTWWRERLRRLDSQDPTLVAGFDMWGMYASHDIFRPIR